MYMYRASVRILIQLFMSLNMYVFRVPHDLLEDHVFNYQLSCEAYFNCVSLPVYPYELYSLSTTKIFLLIAAIAVLAIFDWRYFRTRKFTCQIRLVSDHPKYSLNHLILYSEQRSASLHPLVHS